MGSTTIELPGETPDQRIDHIDIPAPTVWPIILALGIALLFAGLLTSASVSIFGAILAISGSVGWFRRVLPCEKHESVSVSERVAPVATTRPSVERVAWMSQELPRARLPLEIYPVTAGIKGGLAGGVVMAVLAAAYGIVSGHGVWYPINLLSAGFFPERTTLAQIAAFSWDALIVATAIHLVCSLVVGMLYGATLPMFPRRPILLGGIIAPILWSGLLHSILDVLNPVLNQRVDWLWFVLSQIGFGLVAGTVVWRQERVRTWQYLPFAVRAGIETPGVIDKNSGGGQAQ